MFFLHFWTFVLAYWYKKKKKPKRLIVNRLPRRPSEKSVEIFGANWIVFVPSARPAVLGPNGRATFVKLFFRTVDTCARTRITVRSARINNSHRLNSRAFRRSLSVRETRPGRLAFTRGVPDRQSGYNGALHVYYEIRSEQCFRKTSSKQKSRACFSTKISKTSWFHCETIFYENTRM